MTDAAPERAEKADAALLQAARDDNLHALAAAHAAGGDVNAREDGSRRTPLMIAAENRNLEMTQWLLDAGARVTPALPPAWEDGTPGMNVYHIAASATPEIMSLLLKQPGSACAQDFFKDGKENASALRIALKNADREMVLALLDYGIDVNETDNDGETPLYYLLQHRATRAEGLAFIRLLIENGADVDKAVNYWEETPLLTAARADYTEAVALLLDLGADPNRKSRLEDTPLLAAAETYNAKAVALLLDAGADIEAKNRNGRTPLHIAAQHNRLAVVETLLARGANPLAVDKSGQTPDDLCLGGLQARTRGLILEKQAQAGFPPPPEAGLSGRFNRMAKIRVNRNREALLRRGKRQDGKYGGRFRNNRARHGYRTKPPFK